MKKYKLGYALSVALVLLVGCSTTSPPQDLETVSLLCERAALYTAKQRVAECPACREDFQSAFDILDVLLDEPMSLRDLVGALSWMKVSQLTGPNGSLLITEDNVFIVTGNEKAKPIPKTMVVDVANAVWVGLNKYFSLPTEK